MGDNINIEKIMNEIRKQIQEEGLKDDALEFKEIGIGSFIPPIFKIEALEEEIQSANENMFIDFDVEIRTSPIKKVIKKVIKKLMYFQLKPVVSDQNLYNMSVVRTINLIYSYILENERKKYRMDRIINKLMDENEEMKKNIWNCRRKWKRKNESNSSFVEFISRGWSWK